MTIFNKIKYVRGECHFCGIGGSVLIAQDHKKTDIPVCDSCATKLITGISTALGKMAEDLKTKVEEVQSEATELE